MKTKLTWLFIVVLFGVSCDTIHIPTAAQITGRLFYIDPITGKEIDAPQNTPVKVAFNTNGIQYYGYSFKTTDEGRLYFQPSVAGSYDLIVTVTDSVLQFDPTIVVPKEDLDSTRKAEYALIDFTDSTHFQIGRGNSFFSQDFKLMQDMTSLLLILKDEAGNTLKGMRVCIYDNETFASENSPYCGGALAYLETNEKGEALFTGLQPKVYYVNARGTVGKVNINNQFTDAIKTTDALQKGTVSSKEIILK